MTEAEMAGWHHRLVCNQDHLLEEFHLGGRSIIQKPEAFTCGFHFLQGTSATSGRVTGCD